MILNSKCKVVNVFSARKICYHRVAYPHQDPRIRFRLALEYLPHKERGIEDYFSLIFSLFITHTPLRKGYVFLPRIRRTKPSVENHKFFPCQIKVLVFYKKPRMSFKASSFLSIKETLPL